MNYKLLVMFFVLLGSSSGSAQEKLTLNGIYWNGMSMMQKVGFVQGYLHGYDQGYAEGKMGAISVLDPKMASARTPAALEAAPVINPDGITVGQFIEGIDACFKDYRNAQLPISNCVNWVTMGVHGSTDAQREKMLESARKFATEHPQ